MEKSQNGGEDFHTTCECNQPLFNHAPPLEISPGDCGLSFYICVKSISEVKADAHCRFDAISRTYEYIIYNSKNPFLVDNAYFLHKSLDVDEMNNAANCLFDFIELNISNSPVTTPHSLQPPPLLNSAVLDKCHINQIKSRLKTELIIDHSWELELIQTVE